MQEGSGSNKIGENFIQVDNCPVCGDNRSTKLYEIKYTSNEVIEELKLRETPAIFLHRCIVCKHHFASPVINQDLLNNYYLTSNNEYYNTQVEPVNNRVFQNENIVQEVERIKNGGELLEIGCGYGFLLNAFNPEKWLRCGVEPTIMAADYALRTFNLEIHQGVFRQGLFNNKKFDVILLFDVIEHLPDPNNLISMISKSLKNDGLLVIGTGNISSFNAVMGGPIWNYFCTYLHINFFSEKSIRYLLGKNSFDTIKMIKWSYMGSYAANINTLFKNIIKAFLHHVFRVGKNLRVLNSFDHIIVLAKNKNTRLSMGNSVSEYHE